MQGEEHVQYAKTPLKALTERFGANNVRYAKGCDILIERNPEAPVFPGDVDSDILNGLKRTSPISRDTSLIQDAVACARQCDVAIAFVGDLAGLFQTGTVGEGSDTDSLQLPGVQEELLQEVIATGTPTIIVMTKLEISIDPHDYSRKSRFFLKFVQQRRWRGPPPRQNTAKNESAEQRTEVILSC
jgi:beta-xylosidase